jgi:hypothetical protein
MMKMTANLNPFVLLLGLAAIFSSGCTPEPGPGGNGEIKGSCAHHARLIPNTRVFIKYGTVNSPGTDLSVYDDSTVAGSDARFSFKDLEKGNYYLYGIGFDSSISLPVTAGVPVVLDKKEVQDILIPVTE